MHTKYCSRTKNNTKHTFLLNNSVSFDLSVHLRHRENEKKTIMFSVGMRDRVCLGVLAQHSLIGANMNLIE